MNNRVVEWKVKYSGKAASVKEYLESVPPERRAVLSKLRALIRRRISKGYQESLASGAITWSVPLARFPNTYNGHPLGYVALAATSNRFSLHLMQLYMNPREQKAFADAFRKADKKLDMGKGCVRFHSLDDLPLDVIADTVAKFTPEAWIALYEKSRARRSQTRR